MQNKASSLESPSQHAVHFSRGMMLDSTKRFHGRRNLAETLQPLETRKPSVTKNASTQEGIPVRVPVQRPRSSDSGSPRMTLTQPQPFRLRTVGRRGTRFNYSFDEDAEDMTVEFTTHPGNTGTSYPTKTNTGTTTLPTPILGVTLVSTSLPKLPSIAITAGTNAAQRLRQVLSSVDVRRRL
jgi:hypothetical protein